MNNETIIINEQFWNQFSRLLFEKQIDDFHKAKQELHNYLLNSGKTVDAWKRGAYDFTIVKMLGVHYAKIYNFKDSEHFNSLAEKAKSISLKDKTFVYFTKENTLYLIHPDKNILHKKALWFVKHDTELSIVYEMDPALGIQEIEI